MAFASVGPLGALLGRMGLSYILQPEEVAAPFSLCALPGASGTRFQSAPQAGRPRQAQNQPSSWLGGQDHRQRTVAPPIPFTRTAPETWPGPWQNLHARMKTAWLCWTYWELGEDLCGTADPGRRQVLGQLISSLRRPAGTSTFWPPALPAEEGTGQSGLVPSRDLFWSGVRELGVRMIVAMGFRASIAIGLPQEEVRPLHWEIRNGVIVCTTWDFFRIAEQPSRLGDIVTFLNTTIRQLRL